MYFVKPFQLKCFNYPRGNFFFEELVSVYGLHTTYCQKQTVVFIAFLIALNEKCSICRTSLSHLSPYIMMIDSHVRDQNRIGTRMESMDELGELIVSNFLRVSVVGSTNEIVGWRGVPGTGSHSTSHSKPHTTDTKHVVSRQLTGLFIGTLDPGVCGGNLRGNF